MKIALVIEQMDPARGGRETSTAQIAAALARRGHEVTVLCQQGRWECPGVEVRPLGRRGLSRTGRYRNFQADVLRQIPRSSFDVVHAVTPVVGATVYQPRGGTAPGQAEARRRRGRAAAFREAVLGPLNVYRRELAGVERRLTADPAVTCLALSRMVAQEFERHFGRTRDVRVVYNGVDVPDVPAAQREQWRQEFRRSIGAGADDPVFLTVARNFALKGVDEAMLNFMRWCDSRGGGGKARLVVVGKSLVSIPHRSLAVQEIMDRIRMVPWSDDIFAWYSAADVCLLLSWYDACSRVVLESVRWGLPAITTAYNGAAEALAEGAGRVVESPQDSPAILRAMAELADPARRQQCRQACAAAADRLSMDRHVEELLAVYAQAGRTH